MKATRIKKTNKAPIRDLKPKKNPKGGGSETLPLEEVSFNYGKINKSSPLLYKGT